MLNFLNSGWLILYWCVYFFTTIYGHVALKISQQHVSGQPSLWELATNFWIVSAGISWVVSAIVWYLILGKTSLISAASISSLSYFFLVVATAIFVKEPLSLPQLIGSALICIGIYCVVSK